MIYFLQQIQEQFFLQCVSYQEAPEAGPRVEERPPEAETLQNPADLLRWGEEGVSVARSSDARLQEELGILAQAELRDQELSALAENITPSESERALLEIEAETELNTEQRREILEARLAEISERELTHDGEEGPRRIIEAAYVAEIAEEVGIDPQLLMDLRAADFGGAMSWEEAEVMGNYEEMIQNLQTLAEEEEEEGVDLNDLSASEIITLQERRQDVPLTDAEAQAMPGIIGETGLYQFDPETPGLRTLQQGGEQIQVVPDGSYTRNGQVYPAPTGGQEAFPNYGGPAGQVDTNPGRREGELMIRDETLGGQALEAVYDRLSPEDREQIDAIMSPDNEPLQMYPIAMEGGVIEFISNPTYAPDEDGYQSGNPEDIAGNGVSTNEAVAYAQQHGLLLPTRAQTDAARQQAQVRGVMPTHPNESVSTDTQIRNTISQRTYLESTIRGNGNVLVGGVTKIWAFDAGREPGLNGGIRNLENGRSWQGYSTVHGPDYADYSQAAQFVDPLRIIIGPDGDPTLETRGA